MVEKFLEKPAEKDHFNDQMKIRKKSNIKNCIECPWIAIKPQRFACGFMVDRIELVEFDLLDRIVCVIGNFDCKAVIFP